MDELNGGKLKLFAPTQTIPPSIVTVRPVVISPNPNPDCSLYLCVLTIDWCSLLTNAKPRFCQGNICNLVPPLYIVRNGIIVVSLMRVTSVITEIVGLPPL